MTIVPRTCTELPDDGGTAPSKPPPPQPLSTFRECTAYVLLGDPGMGKTTAFQEEALALGPHALLVTARDFANFDADDHPDWLGKTLFIDGLDEIRAGQADPRTPFDDIRRNLDRLGKPRFRLSCRHADWLTTDQKRLAAVSPTGDVTVLRLDSLDGPRSVMLLKSEPNVQDADAFLDEARSRGMDGLLANPQSLNLLVQAVHDGAWPGSRAETFEKACLAMANEHNEEHLSVRPPGDPDRILDTAGCLCAALLLSGTPGCATTRPKANEDYPYMTACGLADEACRQATASKLFRFREAGRAEPIHRHIAEYIGARHIASRIDGGLPSLRVAALLSGPDGIVVSELRGLSAWLAARSPVARHHLIERDPTGVALYGDIQAFSAEEHQALFHALVREPRRLEPTYKTAPAFASLATPAMHDVLERTLANPPGGADGPLVVDFVLRVLRESRPLPSLAPTLLEIARDSTRWPRVRDAALNAFIHYSRDADHHSDLVALLRDVHERHVEDPDDQLLGELLSALYPRAISPAAVWDYIKEANELYVGAYMRFWVSELPSTSSDSAVADLLDSCSDRLSELERVSGSTLESCVAHLLVRGLESHGDNLDVGKLYDWLDAGVRLHVGQHSTRSDAPLIRRWIEERPHRHVDVLLEGIRRYPDEYWYAPYEAFQRLFGATVSRDFYQACALEAKSTTGRPRHAAEPLLQFVLQSGRLEPQHLRELVGDDTKLSGLLARLLEPPPPPTELSRLEQAERVRVEEQHREARRALETLKANERALRENRASPALLYRLARAYFGTFVGFTRERAVRRLEELVESDTELLEAVQTGLRLALDRDDLPTADTILQQRLQSKMHYLCWPYLAGLAEAERMGSVVHSWWTTENVRKALVAYFGYGHGDYEPSWYQHLIAEHPATVAEVQVQFAAALFREGIDTANANLWHLAFNPAHARVARHASLPLLSAFPTRANSEHLRALNYLLLAAFQHADPAEFEQLITRKLSRKSIPPRQRGRWIAAGCAVATAEYAPAATAFVCAGRQQARTLHLASFFCPEERTVFPVERSGIRLAALLIRLVGRFIGPDESSHGIVTLAMEASTLVGHCIRVLAGSPDADATNALTGLLPDPQLSRWHHSLARAADEQRLIRRDHEYRHPTFEHVVETLRGGAPAGPGDLAALVLDRLDLIAAQIRSENTDNWKLHWNEDAHGRPIKPKREESCTRALLSELRRVLPPGVGAEPEVRCAKDARADICVSHGDYHVPVEVKRNDNRELWRAARTQLIAKYASDPATNGHGIYVVLWFGRDRTRRSPEGRRPVTASDLKRQLETTLTYPERRTISFRVIDVSQNPPPAP